MKPKTPVKTPDSLKEMRRGIVGACMQNLLESMDPERNLSQLEIVCQSMIDAAKQGNVQAANTVFDRVEGKPVQQLSPAQAIQIVRSMSLEDYAYYSGIPVSELEKQRDAYQQAQLIGGQDGDDTREDIGLHRLPGDNDDQAGLAVGDGPIPSNSPISPEVREDDLGGDERSRDAGDPFEDSPEIPF